MLQNPIVYQKTFHNHIKACFSNKKYSIAIQTRPTQIVNSIFLMEKPLTRFIKIIGVQNRLPITFDTDLIYDTHIRK